MQSSKTNKTTGVLLVESQPPHAGEFLLAKQMLNEYDFLYVCIIKSTIVINIQSVIAMWITMFDTFADRMRIANTHLNFKEVSADELPVLFDGCTYLTIDKEIFVHLSTLNVHVELLPKVLGYHGIFLRTAYRQSKALNWLEAKFGNKINKI